MMENNKNVVCQINVNFNNKVYFYKGIILDEDDRFITLKDIKIGNIQINKSMIITKRVISNE